MTYNIPSGWQQARLKDIGKIVGGGTPSTKMKEYYENGDIPWITPKDLSDYNKKSISQGERNITELGLEKSSAKLHPKGTVLFSSRAPIGYVAIASNEVATNQGFKSVIPDYNITTSDFVYYLLKYNTEKIKNVGSGSTFSEVSGKVMKEIEILLPPYKEQVEIANILSSFDDKIENNNAIIANLEEQAQAVLKNILNDYNFIQVKLKQLIDIYSGFAFKSKNYTPDGKHKIITIKNIEDGKINELSINKIDNIPDNIKEEAFLEIGDIVFSMTGNVGRTALVYKKGLLLNQRVGKILLDRPEHISFYYFLFRNSTFKQRLIGLAHGTAQANLGKIATLNLEIPYNKAAMDDFSNVFNPVVNKIISLMKQNDNLVAIRDALSPKLMSGEVRIEEAIEVE